MSVPKEEALLLLGWAVASGRGAPVAGRPLQGILEKEDLQQKGLREWERTKALGGRIVFYEDPDYPPLLREIKEPPAFIYVKGSLPREPLLAIVGARKASPYGLRIAREWSRYLASAGLGIVSGLALGIDSQAHRGALEAGGYTLAVLGAGLDNLYPPQNRKLAEEIVDQGGALVTEFPLGSQPERWHFPRRNRILAGLCQGVLVVEAALRSGSLITARVAVEEGREVMAVPGSIFSEQSRGTHLLLREGAHPVTSPEEVLDILGISLQRNEEKNGLSISEAEEAVLERLSEDPKSYDDLLLETGLSPGELSERLLSLEMKGLIQELPGKRYQRLV